MTTIVFPGQGSQQLGMGEDLFSKYPDICRHADELLGYSVEELCLRDPLGQLSQTQYTQVALYVVNALSYMNKLEESGEKPGFVAGHSLGEYNALLAADAFDFITGLELVKKRGELMAKAQGGGMAAILGLDETTIKQVLSDHALDQIDIANFNSPQQIVISGLKDDVIAAKPFFEAAGAKRVIALDVSGAFHSRHMSDAKNEFESFLNSFSFNELTMPVISNVTALPYENANIKQNLANQITHSVRWTDSIQFLVEKGEEDFIEVGPGKVLTGLIKRIRR